MRMTLSRKEMVKKVALDVLKAFIIAIVANTVIINPIEPSVNWNGPRI